jgi:predicted MFS family arabinose efflux permease
MTAGNATGQLVFVPALAAITTTLGWRWAVTAIPLVALFLVVPLVRCSCATGRSTSGSRPTVQTSSSRPRHASGSAFKAAFGGLALGPGSGTFLADRGPVLRLRRLNQRSDRHARDPGRRRQGVSEVAAAGYLAAIGVFDIVGTTFSGWLTDRYDPRLVLFC